MREWLFGYGFGINLVSWIDLVLYGSFNHIINLPIGLIFMVYSFVENKPRSKKK